MTETTDPVPVTKAEPTGGVSNGSAGSALPEVTVEQLRTNIKRLLATQGYSTWRPCKRCKAPIVFIVTHKNKVPMPISENGCPHFVDCPNADEFRKGGKS